jgi:hypothetical protein
VPDAAVNLSPVGLELSFARSASADAAAELRHFHAAPRQPRKHVFELRQFHLQLTFTSAGVARKNIENQLRAIDDARVDHAFNVALLRRREIVIEQNHIRGNRGCRARNFFQLALADQRGRIGRSLRCVNSPAISAPALVASVRNSSSDSEVKSELKSDPANPPPQRNEDDARPRSWHDRAPPALPE